MKRNGTPQATLKLVQPPPGVEQAPRDGTVGWAFRTAQRAADAMARDPATPATSAQRAMYLAWAAAIFGELLATPDGECALDGLATAQDLVAGAMWIADRQQMIAEAIPDRAAPEVRKAMERAAFLRGLISALDGVGDAGDARAITRLWSTLTANLVALCTSGKIPPKMQTPYLNEVLMWSRETTWIAAFELVVQREYMDWLDDVVPTQEPCATCGIQGTETQPNGSHPRTGDVACFAHRALLPAIDPPPRPDEAPGAVVSVVVATTDEGRRLYTRGPQLWSLPGGKRQDGESSRRCAQRELLEETGLDVDEAALHFVAVVTTHDGQPMAVFACDAAALRYPPLPSSVYVNGRDPSDGWLGPEGDCAFMPDALAGDAYRKDWVEAWRGVLTAIRQGPPAPVDPAVAAIDRAAAAEAEARAAVDDARRAMPDHVSPVLSPEGTAQLSPRAIDDKDPE